MQVLRVQNPAIFKHPEVETLLRRAFLDRPASIDIEAAQADFDALVSSDQNGVFIGVDDDAVVRAIGIIMLPQNALVACPQVLVMYSEGQKSLTNAVLGAGVDFVREAGFDHYWALNRSGRNDDVWARALKHAGHATKVASLMQFEVP